MLYTAAKTATLAGLIQRVTRPQVKPTGLIIMANDLSSLLAEGVILMSQPCESRKQVIHLLADAIATKLGLEGRDVFDAVMERENLGSTGVGEGVAIPHARIEGQPCDLIFMLLAPHSSGADHLRALAQVSRAFRNSALRDKLRETSTPDSVMAVLCPKAMAANAA